MAAFAILSEFFSHSESEIGTAARSLLPLLAAAVVSKFVFGHIITISDFRRLIGRPRARMDRHRSSASPLSLLSSMRHPEKIERTDERTSDIHCPFTPLSSSVRLASLPHLRRWQGSVGTASLSVNDMLQFSQSPVEFIRCKNIMLLTKHRR